MVQQINLFLIKIKKKMIKIGIIGVGYFGEKHLINLLELNKIFDVIGIYDQNTERSKAISKKYNVKKFNSIEKITQDCDAIDITASTDSHYEIIKLCISKEKHIFLEKPVSENLEETKELTEETKNYKKIIQIGFIERFNDAFLSTSSLDFSIKKIKAIRSGTITERNEKSCIVQDMMIHDIDIINYIINSSIKDVSVKSDSTKNKVTCKLKFKNNCTAEIKAERSALISRDDSERTIIIQTKENENIKIDLLNRKIYWNKEELEKVIKKPNALKNELTYFHDCIKKGTKNKISIQSAYKSAIIASKINEKINALIL